LPINSTFIMENPDLAIVKFWGTIYCSYLILRYDSGLTSHFPCKIPLELHITVLLRILGHFLAPALYISQLTPISVCSNIPVKQ
jgi:hypothetical protein